MRWSSLHRALFASFPLALLATPCDGQSGRATVTAPPPAAKPATVEGDIYLVMQSGDTKPGAGRTVYLLADTPEFRARHDQICTSHQARHEVARAADSAEFERRSDLIRTRQTLPSTMPDAARRERAAAIDSVTSLIATVIRAQVPSGMAAHYRLEGVVPGRYILFSEWKIGNEDYQWWSPIVLTPAQAMRHDLDNSTEAGGKVYCKIR